MEGSRFHPAFPGDSFLGGDVIEEEAWHRTAEQQPRLRLDVAAVDSEAARQEQGDLDHLSTGHLHSDELDEL
jgi:hypothetical protein